MPTAEGVLVMTRDPQTARAVADAARETDGLSVRQSCHTFDELLLALDSATPAVALVDIEEDPARMLADLESIVGRSAETRFIVLVQEHRADLLLKAMQCGVRHCVLKSELGRELPGVLQRMSAATAQRRTTRGVVLTVLGAGGGCGATTLAVNLAHEAGLASGEPSLIVDLDTRYGSVATCLGIEAQFGIADVLADGERIDANLLRSTAYVHSDQIHALVSPASVDFAQPRAVQADQLSRALLKCREAYACTVIDAPRLPLSLASQLAVASAMTYIVLEATVKDLRVARRIRDALLERQVATSRILPVVTKYHGRSEAIRIDEIRKALDCELVELLPDDRKSVVASINFGKPLAEEAPRSALRAAIGKLAAAVRAPAAEPQEIKA